MKNIGSAILMLTLATPVPAQAFDYAAFKAGCQAGATAGQKFLQSSKLTKDLKELKAACVLTQADQKPLAKLDKSDSRRYGCGAGMALALQKYQQMTLLKSPRSVKLINQCSDSGAARD